MKASALNELKKELSFRSPEEVLNVCIRLAKLKKENKELLTYLLFERDNELTFIKTIKSEIDNQFGEINHSNMYYIKKSIRKILRNTTKHIKYSGIPQTEVELLIYFCSKIKSSGVDIITSNALCNMYSNQLQKISKTLSGMHEDLQFDYGKQLEKLKLVYFES